MRQPIVKNRHTDAIRYKPQVAVCLSQQRVLTDTMHALRLLKLRYLTVQPEVGWTRSQEDCALFLYDLAPFTDAAYRLVRDTRRVLPILPILLYPPARRGVGELVRKCTRIPSVRVEIQDPGAPPLQVLPPVVTDLLASAPAGDALYHMWMVLPGRPRLVREFLAAVLYGLQGGRFRGHPSVSDVARSLGTTPRSLQRTWKGYALTSPQKLIGWATLLFVCFSAKASGSSVTAAGRAIGIDAQQIYRLRARFLTPELRAHRGAERQLNAALNAFAEDVPTRRLAGRLLADWLDQRANDGLPFSQDLTD